MGRSDAELLEASRRGERDAFGALIERYQGVVSAVTYSRTGDHALSEDVAQDTFIAAWHQLGQLREPGRLRSWLCGIARNLARKARRRSAREAPLERVLVFEGANPFDHAAQAESGRVVRDALLRVPETYRDVLVLYYRDQRSVRDVAAALGLTEAAVLQRLARGRQYLADGVTDLVERALRTPRTSRNLAALVLAALPAAIAPSRADAATSPHGGTMIKLAIVVATAAATLAGGTAYVIHTRAAASPPAAIAAPPAGPAAARPLAVVPSGQPTVATPPGTAVPSGAPAAGNRVPDPEDMPMLDRATIERTALHRGPARGPATAPVTIVVFTDLICSFCGNALGTIDQLWEDYPNMLRLVVKQFPVHPAAVLPAEASLAADAQGKFWEMHDLMLAHQDDLSHDQLIVLAERLGLDVVAFRTALDQHTYAAAVKADQATAAELAIQGTPAFVINGKRVIGNLQQMRKIVDQAIADL